MGWPKAAGHETVPPRRGPLLASAAAAGIALVGLFLLARAAGRTPGLAGWAALAAAAAGALVLVLLRTSSSPLRSAGALLVLLVALPLPLASRDVFASVSAEELTRPPHVVSDLLPGAPGRIFPAASDGALLKAWLSAAGPEWTEDVPRRAHEALAGYGTLAAGLASAASPSPIGNPRRTEMLGAAFLGGDAATLLGLADVRHAVTPFPSTMFGARLERRTGPVLRYAIERPAGRVFFAREAIEAADDLVRSSLASRTFDFEERAFLAPGGGALPPPRPERGFAVAKVTRDEAESLEIETAISGPAVLVVTRSWDSGWEASLDGEPAAVRRCDLALMAVTVPAGEHRIALRYRPASFRIGAGVSIVAALVLAGLLVAGGAEPPP